MPSGLHLSDMGRGSSCISGLASVGLLVWLKEAGSVLWLALEKDALQRGLFSNFGL